MNKKLIKKYKGGDTFIGLLPEEQEYLDYIFTVKGTNSPEYNQFKQAMINKYGNRTESSLRLPEVIIEGKRPEKTLADNAKENVKEVKQKWNNLPTDSKVDLALTGAGFIPGLDVVADIVDMGREAYKGNWGNAAIAAGFALLPVSYGAYKAGKYLKNNVRVNIPKADYYRVLSDLDDSKVINAVQDLQNTGVVRINPKGTYKRDGSREHYIGPYFYKEVPFRAALDKSSKILTSSSNNLDWLPIKPHETILRKTLDSNQFTPLYHGVPNTAPVSEFQLWERGNNFITKNFWFKRELPAKEISVKPFTYPESYNMVVHTDYGNHKGSFGSGAYINELNTLIPGKNSTGQQNYLWFNENKPYAMSVNGKPVTRVIVGNKNNIDGLTRVRDMNVPVGQWDGSKGFVLNSELVTDKPQNMDNLLLFEWNPKLHRFQLKKSGGRLISKHAKGSPVNNNPLPKRPVNTNPVPEVKPKKRKGLQIRPDFKNERPVPGMLTIPVIGFKQK